jgi:hypothetical protein
MAIALLACAAAACSVGAPASYTQLVPGFEAPHAATQVAGATISSGHSNTPADCASRCGAGAGADECVGFTFDTATSNCTTHDWSPTFTLVAAPASTSYYPRIRTRDTTAVTPAVEYTLSIPTSGVTLHSGILKDAFEANIVYLLKFPVDDMLYWFRVRNGTAAPPGANWGWDNGGPDKPYGLRVSRCTSWHPFRLCALVHAAVWCRILPVARSCGAWCRILACETLAPHACPPCAHQELGQHVSPSSAHTAIQSYPITPHTAIQSYPITPHTAIQSYPITPHTFDSTLRSLHMYAFPIHHDDRGRWPADS